MSSICGLAFWNCTLAFSASDSTPPPLGEFANLAKNDARGLVTPGFGYVLICLSGINTSNPMLPAMAKIAP